MTTQERRTRRSILMWTAVAVVAGLSLGAGANSRGPDLASRALKLLEEERHTTRSPAISAALALKGSIVWSGSVGIADLERDEPASAATVYNIGSVSKVITAVAVTQLIEQGKVKPEDPVQKYVPAFPEKSAPVTVWNLLTHTSGIRHYRAHDFPGPDWEENHHPYASLTEAIGIFKDDPLLFRPGSYYFYSSYGVNLLQGVVERASGLGFEDYLRQRVWAKADMSSTGLDVVGRIVPHRARGYNLKDGKPIPTIPIDVSYKYASGGMLSTAEDLVRLGIALNHGRLMGAAACAQMWSPQVPVVRRFRTDGPPVTEKFQQGYLWRLVKRPFGNFVYHCGSFNGFNVCILDDPRRDLVAAMAYNSDEGGMRPLEKLAGLIREP